MVLFKKIVKKNSVNKLKQGESTGFQVPGSIASTKIMYVQKTPEILKHKSFEVSIWHQEPGTWHFLGKSNKPTIS